MAAMDHKTGRMSLERHSMEDAIGSLLTLCESEVGKSDIRGRLLGLQGKLSSNRFHLAVLGQMKRGKSSFINALLGAEVLPTGVLPITAAITEIKYSASPAATIHYSTGQSESIPLAQLANYITEAGNPGNRKQVGSIEIIYPSSFLKGNIVLIDTPGIGSTHAHNTRTTESYLEKIDAAIVVLSVDPPITQVESDFLARIKSDIPKFFFVLNKIDLATPVELSSISTFLLEEFKNRLQFESPELFSLSARQALAAKRNAADVSFANGLKEFEDRLLQFLSEEKEQVLIRSIALEVISTARAMHFAASIGIRARALSFEDLTNKSQTLNQLVAQAELELREIHVLLRQRTADIVAQVEGDLKSHVEAIIPGLRQRIKLFATQHSAETGSDLGRILEEFLTQVVDESFRKWRVQEDARIGAELHSLSHRSVAQANGILDRLQQAASALFEVPVEQLTIACDLDVESHLLYKIDPIFYSLDNFLLFLPRFLLRPVVFRKVSRKLFGTLDRNAGRIRYDYIERIEKSMSRFDKELHLAVSAVTESLKSALWMSPDKARTETVALCLMDSVVGQCAQLLESGLTASSEGHC
ncbi:MAG: dynamin family protein [Acidobacteriaceae bacterium]